MPTSTTSTPGTICGWTRNGGSVAPLLDIGVAPSGRSSSANVPGATSVCPGGIIKDCRSDLPIAGAVPTSTGSVDRLDAQYPQRSSLDLDAALDDR